MKTPSRIPRGAGAFTSQEPDISIWKRKLDWIVRQGGMACLNTHPDYMNFKVQKCSLEQYPVNYYEEFINYVKTEYENQFWQPLPSEMAAFWRKTAITGIITE